MKWKLQRSALAGLALVAMSAPALAATYTVKPGDTLSKLRPSDWRQVCEQNMLANCGRIFVGQKLVFPDGDKPQVAKVNSEPKQEKSCIKLGTAPFNQYGSMKLRLQGIDISPDLTAEERDEAKRLILAGGGDKRLVTKDMVFKAMPFRSKSGRVKFVHDVRVCTPEQGGRPEVVEVWKLSTGKLVGDFETCGNLSVMWEPPKMKEPEPPAPVVTPPAPAASAPAPHTTEPKLQQPEPRPTPTPEPIKQSVSCLEPSGVVGTEIEPRYNSAANRANYASGDIRCTLFDNDEYRVSVGLGGQYVNWNGYNQSGGTYDGDHYLWGPSLKVVSHNGGWDAAVRFPAFGKLESNYRQAAFASSRKHDLRGVTASVNNFARKLRGEQHFYETQVSVAWAKAMSTSRLSQTVFGQELADHGRPTDYYLNVTVREYLKRVGENHELYAQLGLNFEQPFSRSASFRLGDAVYERCAGYGAGVDYDFITDGVVPAYGGWVDPFQCGDAYRIHVRGAQIVREAKAAGVNFASDSIGPPAK